MKGMTINQVAIGSALLLHGLVFAIGGWVEVNPPEPAEQIAIRFTSAEKRDVPVRVEELSAPAVKPSPLNENKNRLQKVAATRMPVQETVPSKQPITVPAPVQAIQPLRPVEQASAVAHHPQLAPSEPVGSVTQKVPQKAAPPSVAELPRQDGGVPSPEGKRPGAVTEPSPRLADYLALVRGLVENNREYPAMARQLGLTGTVTVRVSIRGDGSISEVTVAGSAGHKSLDKAALSAVKRAAPFKPPKGFGLGQVTVEIPMVYRLR